MQHNDVKQNVKDKHITQSKNRHRLLKGILYLRVTLKCMNMDRNC